MPGKRRYSNRENYLEHVPEDYDQPSQFRHSSRKFSLTQNSFRIDLAKVYQEIGDKDSAMRVRQAGMREGDTRESARLLLANLQVQLRHNS